jgi:DNA-binding transcriptional regulator YiaG
VVALNQKETKMSNVKTQREQFGLSQMQLARLANVSRFRLHLAERGDICLRQDEMARIRVVLQKTAQRLEKAISDFGSLPAA